jgi:hypothetical protein
MIIQFFKQRRWLRVQLNRCINTTSGSTPLHLTEFDALFQLTAIEYITCNTSQILKKFRSHDPSYNSFETKPLVWDLPRLFLNIMPYSQPKQLVSLRGFSSSTSRHACFALDQFPSGNNSCRSCKYFLHKTFRALATKADYWPSPPRLASFLHSIYLHRLFLKRSSFSFEIKISNQFFSVPLTKAHKHNRQIVPDWDRPFLWLNYGFSPANIGSDAIHTQPPSPCNNQIWKKNIRGFSL